MTSGGTSFVLGVLVALSVVLGGWLIFKALGKNHVDADETTPDKTALSRTALQQIALVVFGLAAIVTGAVAVFRGKDGTTATAIVTAGFAVIALIYLGPRLQSIKLGTLELVLAEFEKDAVQAENDGDEERAEDLRRAAMNAVLVALRETGNPAPTPPRPSAAQAENARWTETEALDLLQAVMSIAFKGTTIEKWPRIDTGKPGNPPRADLLIASRNSPVVYIELAPRLTQKKRERLVNIAGTVTRNDQHRLLVLAGPDDVDPLIEELEGQDHAQVLVWTPGQDVQPVVAAVGSLLTA